MQNDQKSRLSCFKAYDIRGRVPGELNADLAYRIGLSTARYLQGGRFAVGRDCRLSSAELCGALTRGLTDAGADVVDIGRCGTSGPRPRSRRVGRRRANARLALPTAATSTQPNPARPMAHWPADFFRSSV